MFDDNIINKILDHTNNRINETIARLQRVESYNKSIDRCTWVKGTDKIKLDALFGLMYFRGLLVVNLYLTDRLISPDSYFVFNSIISKNRFRFLQIHLCFGNAEEKPEFWKTDRFAATRQILELFSFNLSKYVPPSEYLSIDKTLHPMRNQ